MDEECIPNEVDTLPLDMSCESIDGARVDQKNNSTSSLGIKRPALAMTEDSTVAPYPRKKRKQSMSSHTSEESNMDMQPYPMFTRNTFKGKIC